LAPTVDLVAPAWGTVVQVGAPVLFSAVADDPDGAEGALVWTWTSDLDGVFSTAPGDDAGHIDIVDAARSVGVHTITVEVADPDGLVARDVTALEVRAAPDGPSPPVVEIVPADPFTDEALVAVVVTPSVDPAGGAVTLEWAWTVDGAAVPDLTGDTVDPAWTARGERWVVTATPTASGLTGAAGTDAVTIQNSPPEAPVVTITPASPSSGEALVCSVAVGAFDLDGDPIGYALSWDVDGASYGGAITGVLAGDTVPGGVIEDGSTWTCAATPDDGVDVGPPGSASVTVRDVLRGCPDSSCALRFDGVDDYLEVPDHPSLSVGASAWTVEAWVYYDHIGNCMTAVRKGTSSSPTYEYWLHKSYLPEETSFWGSWASFTVSTYSVLGAGRWIHYAGDYDPVAGQARTYVNGVVVGTTSPSTAPIPNGDPLRIGIDWDMGCETDGVIDEVRITRRARYGGASFAPSVILSADADTVALWRFEEYTGAIAYDESGNGNHATIYGAAWTTESP
jgi:hypothetical protein